MKARNFNSLIRSIVKSQDNRASPPLFIGNEKRFINETIDSNYVSSVGKFVDKFEKRNFILNNKQICIATVNGTSALQIALILGNVKQGDEVLTQALSFVATSNAISYLKAKPVFIDVDIDTMGMSPSALESFLEEFGEKRETGTYNKLTGSKISACLPMHTFGFM